MDDPFFYGVVESIDDPEMLGRVRVRIFGVHSDQTVADQTTGRGIATKDLPLAHVMMPTTSPSMTGYGPTPFLLEGSWVIGIKRDEVYNDLVVIGTIPGKPSAVNPNPINPSAPFAGGDGQYPNKEFVGESDLNRLARGSLAYKDAKFAPAPAKIKQKLTTGIAIAGGGTWDEKDPAYAAKYPLNRVFATPAGHTIEVDDTPGAERISIYHGTTGTYFTILPDGSIQQKVIGDDFEIVLKGKNLSVGGNLNITVVGNANLQVQGNVEADITGTTTLNCKDNVTANVTGDITAKASGNIAIKAQGSAAVTSQGNATVTSSGSLMLKASSTTIDSTVAITQNCTVKGREVLTV